MYRTVLTACVRESGIDVLERHQDHPARSAHVAKRLPRSFDRTAMYATVLRTVSQLGHLSPEY
jgi:hypothetical protein